MTDKEIEIKLVKNKVSDIAFDYATDMATDKEKARDIFANTMAVLHEAVKEGYIKLNEGVKK